MYAFGYKFSQKYLGVVVVLWLMDKLKLTFLAGVSAFSISSLALICLNLFIVRSNPNFFIKRPYIRA